MIVLPIDRGRDTQRRDRPGFSISFSRKAHGIRCRLADSPRVRSRSFDKVGSCRRPPRRAIDVSSKSVRGTHGSTIETKPLTGLSRRLAGPRAQAGQRAAGPGLALCGAPRSWSATSTTRSGRSTSRRARPGWLILSSTCSSRVPSDFPRVRSTGWCCSAGGQSNAETSEDSTHYWFAFPRERWELALAIEADRMRGARFDAGEIEVERRVIVEERARELNSPQGRLDQTHLAVTYLRHPYRNPILGWPEDIARISADDLRAFYQAHYRPDGAVLVVVGDVDPEAALDAIAQPFRETCPRVNRRVRDPVIVEPDQSGRRGFVLADSESAARASWAGAPFPARIPTFRSSTCSPISFAAAGDRVSGRSLVETEKMATWIETAHAAAHRAGPVFYSARGRCRAPTIAVIEQRIIAELSQTPRNRPIGR